MKSELGKLIATVVIWVVVGTTLALMWRSPDIIWMALILGLMALGSMRLMWRNGDSSAEALTFSAGKAKRDNRLSRLVNMLDEDEIEDLSDYLASRRDSRLVNQEDER
jgi:hypothetical protein